MRVDGYSPECLVEGVRDPDVFTIPYDTLRSESEGPNLWWIFERNGSVHRGERVTCVDILLVSSTSLTESSSDHLVTGDISTTRSKIVTTSIPRVSVDRTAQSGRHPRVDWDRGRTPSPVHLVDRSLALFRSVLDLSRLFSLDLKHFLYLLTVRWDLVECLFF